MLMRTTVRFGLLLLPLLVTACGVSIRETPFSSTAASTRPADAPVVMFSTKQSQCAFTELGLLQAEPKTSLTPWSRVVDGFLERARKMGGDGIILQQGKELQGTTDDGNLVSHDVLRGTVIRFQLPRCRF